MKLALVSVLDGDRNELHAVDPPACVVAILVFYMVMEAESVSEMLLVFLNIVFVIMAVVLNEIEFCSDLNSQ
jgi:hypothetical protein